MGGLFRYKNSKQTLFERFGAVFFTASLFLNRKNLKYSTIRNVGHIRTHWEKTGANLTSFDKGIISRIMKGVDALRPTTPD